MSCSLTLKIFQVWEVTELCILGELPCIGKK